MADQFVPDYRRIEQLEAALRNLTNAFHEGLAGAVQREAQGYVDALVYAAEQALATGVVGAPAPALADKAHAITVKHGNFRFAEGHSRARGENIEADLNGEYAQKALQELLALFFAAGVAGEFGDLAALDREVDKIRAEDAAAGVKACPLCDAQPGQEHAPACPRHPSDPMRVRNAPPKRGVEVLRGAIALLREEACYRDDEGEDTDALDDLLKWADAHGVPPTLGGKQ